MEEKTTDKSLDQEIAEFQDNKQMIPLQDVEGCPEKYKPELRRLCEEYLSYLNKRTKVDDELKKLKAAEELAEKSIIRFLETINSTGMNFTDLGNFSKKDAIHANLLKENELRLFQYFKAQRREKEFFEVKPRMGNLNTEIRELIKHAEHKEGGLNKKENLELPPGVTYFKKIKMGITKRNHQFQIQEEKNVRN
ncbi:hypothetical protein ACFL2K_00940 [Candidatus Margulisiibacteriota bacterium]